MISVVKCSPQMGFCCSILHFEWVNRGPNLLVTHQETKRTVFFTDLIWLKTRRSGVRFEQLGVTHKGIRRNSNMDVTQASTKARRIFCHRFETRRVHETGFKKFNFASHRKWRVFPFNIERWFFACDVSSLPAETDELINSTLFLTKATVHFSHEHKHQLPVNSCALWLEIDLNCTIQFGGT